MKASKILLLVTGFTILIILIVMLIVFKLEVKAFNNKQKLSENYQLLKVGEFTKVDFSGKWNVRIKQGKKCKIELMQNNKKIIPLVSNEGNTLICRISENIPDLSKPINAIVTLSQLDEIHSKKGVRISLENFDADSVKVSLDSGAIFISKKNSIKGMFYTTSDGNNISIIEQ